MKIQKATSRYEQWLGKQLTIVPSDLKLKHDLMASALFPFLRATYYRWAQIWPEVCGDAAAAPEVLAVGDLHVENFGTWRDVESRLIWGINDFDEAWRLPYTSDLVRLATSTRLARPTVRLKHGCAAILSGYRQSLRTGGQPLVLAEEHLDLRRMATAR